jgi:hypothetical protein
MITSRAIRCEMATRGTWIGWIANEWKMETVITTEGLQLEYVISARINVNH